MRILIRVAVVLLLLGGVRLAVWGTARWWVAKTEAANGPANVRVESVGRGSLVEFIGASGDVEPRIKVAISARVSARIVELAFKEGDHVTRGDAAANPPVPASVLVKLDSKDLEATLNSVKARHEAELASLQVSKTHVVAQQARIDSLKVLLADAKRELKRQLSLLESEDVSQSSVDALRTKVDQQEADLAGAVASLRGEEAGLIVMKHNIDAADAEIAKAADNLTYATILSPIDGVVTRLNAEVGEVAMMGTMNNAGTMILEVADLSQMILKAQVDENAIADVKVGQRAKIHMEAYRNKVFDGVVQNVALANYDPSLARGAGSSRSGNEIGKSFKVEILIDTQGLRIFSGLSADADIETKRHDGVLKVPSQCVLGRSPDTLPAEIRSKPEMDVTKANIPVVYRLINGEAVATPVKIGASDLTHTIIESGLKEEDQVITGPYKVLESLQHGQKVKRETDATSKPAKKPATVPAATQTTRPALR